MQYFLGLLPSRCAAKLCIARGCAVSMRLLHDGSISFSSSSSEHRGKRKSLRDVMEMYDAAVLGDGDLDGVESLNAELDIHDELQQSSMTTSATQKYSDDFDLNLGSHAIDEPSLVGTITQLLPVEGEVPLTSVSPGLPLQEVHEQFGSVVGFLQRHRDRFALRQDDSGRYFVARSKFGGRVTEELSAKKLPPRHRRVMLSSVKSDAATRPVPDGLISLLGKLIDKPMPILNVLGQLPPAEKQLVKAKGSLLRVLRELNTQFDVSGDGLRVGPKGTLPAAAMIPVAYFPLKGTREEFEESAEWHVELDIGDDAEEDPLFTDPFGLGTTPPVQRGNGNQQEEAAAAASPSPYVGAARVAVRIAEPVPSVTVMPPPAKPQQLSKPLETPPPIQKTDAPPRPPALDATAAAARVSFSFWKTPSEMLSLFVKVVPAGFFVRLSDIQMSPELKSALSGGTANAMHRAVRMYSYYFDKRSPMPGVVEVKIRGNVQHPDKGAADVLYKDVKAGPTLHSVPGAPAYPTIFPGQHKAAGRGEMGSQSNAAKVPRAWGRHTVTAKPTDTEKQEVQKQKSEDATVDSPVIRLLWSDIPSGQFREIENIAFSAAVMSHPSIDGSVGSIRKILAAHPRIFMMVPARTQVKLRPIDVAPNAVAEFSAETSPYDAKVLQEVLAKVKAAGVAYDIVEVFSRLPAKAKAGITEKGASFTSFLREHGKVFWVSDDGLTVRKYAMHPQLDDLTHFVVKELERSVGAIATEVEQDVPLDAALNELPENLRGLFDIMKQNEIAKFLQNHVGVFVVTEKLRPDGTAELLVGRAGRKHARKASSGSAPPESMIKTADGWTLFQASSSWGSFARGGAR